MFTARANFLQSLRMEQHPTHVTFFSEDSFVAEALTQAMQRTLGAEVMQILNLSALRRTLSRRPPDVMVIDAGLGPHTKPVHPYALAINAQAAAPKVPVVMLIDAPSMALICLLIRHGVRGVVVKMPDGLHGLLKALPTVLAQSTYLCPLCKSAVTNAPPAPGLSSGEVSLIRLLAQGLTDRHFTRKAMAIVLKVQDNTLGVRIHQLRGKLGVYDDEAIVALARAWGLIE